MISVEEAHCRPSGSGSEHLPLKVVILHTSPELTRAAIKTVEGMTGDLSAEAVLMAVHVVPYPLPLDRPSIPAHHQIRNLEILAKSGMVPLKVQLVLARDRVLAVRSLLPPSALVVIAAKRHWWRTEEDRLARVLRQDGHQLILLQLCKKECIMVSAGSPAAPVFTDGAADCEMAAPQVSSE